MNGHSSQDLHEPDDLQDDGSQEIYLDDADIEELKDMLDEEGDEPMDEDDDDDIQEVDELDEDGTAQADTQPDTSTRRFGSHASAVFAISAHPRCPILVVSGGEDDNGYLWRTDTGEEIAKLGGHTDSVVATGWSSDGELVATGGMDGRVRVWRRVKSVPAGTWEFARWEFLTVLEGMEEITWLDWHPSGPVLACGTGDGTVWMWRLPSGETMNVFSSHTAPCTCGQFLPDGKRLITASEDGSLILWDPRTASPIHKLTASSTSGKFRFHEGGITCLAVNGSGTSALVGAADGQLKIVTLANGSVAQSLEGHSSIPQTPAAAAAATAMADEEAEPTSVERVAWIPPTTTGAGAGLWASVGTDKVLRVFEGSNGSVRWSGKHQDAITSLVVHPAPNTHKISTGSVDRTLKIWDARTGQVVLEHTGHTDVVHTVAVSSDGARVISGSDDGTARVFDASA